MNRMTKRLVSILLALALVASLGVAAFADDAGTEAQPYTTTTSYTSTGAESGTATDSVPDGYISYTLDLNSGDEMFYFDLSYSWEAGLTWTYLKVGNTGAWFNPGEPITGAATTTTASEINLTVPQNVAAAKAAIQARNAEADTDVKKAGLYGVQFTINNKNTNYKLKYSLTDEGGTSNVSVASVEPASGKNRGNVDRYTSVATPATDVVINAASPAETVVPVSSYAVVYPRSYGTATNDNSLTSKVKISFAAVVGESNTEVATSTENHGT